MKTTKYYETIARHQHPELSLDDCQSVLDNPIAKEVQEDKRVRVWGRHPATGKFVRVVLEPDGETIHTAFVDRGFARQLAKRD